MSGDGNVTVGHICGQVSRSGRFASSADHLTPGCRSRWTNGREKEEIKD